MKTVLEQLYTGDLNPISNIYPTSREYQELARRHSRSRDRFCQKLREVSPLLEEEFDAQMEELLALSGMEAEQMFYAGFRLGTRLLMGL